MKSLIELLHLVRPVLIFYQSKYFDSGVGYAENNYISFKYKVAYSHVFNLLLEAVYKSFLKDYFQAFL